MSTFLQLCQRVAQESGTVSGTSPSTVVSQTGRLKSIVDWTASAWTMIQLLHSSWQWMRADGTGTLSSGSARYTGAGSFSLTRFARFVTEKNSISLYETATGVSDEGALTELNWTVFRQEYLRGPMTLSANYNRPAHWAISPAGELCFGPTPDDSYTCRFEYWKTPQTLSANSDEPECPARFHEAIVWLALKLLVENDEAPPVLAGQAEMKYREYLSALRQDQLPRISIGAAPLA